MANFPKEAWVIEGDVPIKVKVLGIQYHDLRYTQRNDPDPPTEDISRVFADYDSCRAAVVANKEAEIERAKAAIASIPASEPEGVVG